jgi:hypothetical protein
VKHVYALFIKDNNFKIAVLGQTRLILNGLIFFTTPGTWFNLSRSLLLNALFKTIIAQL